MQFTRRQFLASAAPLLAHAAARKPNIVFILLDDLGCHDLGCYGQQHILTPNIDRVAAAGMKFTAAYAGGTVCAPSRSVLMTGLHTGHTHIRANAGTVPLLPEDRTVANLLQDAGYATGGFGKWGLGDARSTGIPTRHGFDEFFGYLHQVHAHSYFPEFLWDNEKKLPLPGNLSGKREQYSADLIAERSFDFLKRNRSRPFFLYACYTLPHGRFEVPSLEPYASHPWTDEQKTYAAMVTRADGYVGTILGMLKDFALEQDTIVIISSDNGAPAGEGHGYTFFKSNGILRGSKGQLYEGGIRAPLIVRWPGRVKAGSLSDLPTYFADFLPTAAAIAGVKPPAGIDGISILPELTGAATQPRREYLYWETQPLNRKTNDLDPARLSQAIRMGDWKALRLKPGSPIELYNLRDDPSESRDVASANPQPVARIEAFLKTARTPPRPHSTGNMEFVR